MSIVYHRQIDGQTKVLSRSLQQDLRAFVHNKPAHGEKYLHWTEWNYNTNVHSATCLTSFQVVYGKPSPPIPSYVLSSSNIEAVNSNEDLLSLLGENFSRLNTYVAAS